MAWVRSSIDEACGSNICTVRAIDIGAVSFDRLVRSTRKCVVARPLAESPYTSLRHTTLP